MPPMTVVAPVRRAPPPGVLVGIVFCVVLGAIIAAALVVASRDRSAPRGALDQPVEGAAIGGRGATSVSGWAVDLGARANTGVNRVQLYLDATLVGDADYGQSRPDIAASFGSQFEHAGWTVRLDPQALGPGSHSLEARAHSSVTGHEASYAHTVTVLQPASATVGAIDVPEEQTAVSGIIDARGWAIDEGSDDGTGVDQLVLYLDGAPVERADYGLDRAEIGDAYGGRFRECGWRAKLDTRDWSGGPHVLEARARSTVTGFETTYRRTVGVQPT